MPYTALTHAARLRASRGEEDFLINSQGGLTAKGLDRRNEHLISTIDWQGAARAVEERVREYHGPARGDAFAAHHQVVMDLARMHGWSAAMDYDIQQRELAAANHTHDIGTLDSAAFTLIATRAAPSQSASQFPKRPHASDELDPFPKRQRPACCFRCGVKGHFPSDCKSNLTTAGKPVASVARGSKSKNGLLAPNGKQYCFSWARSSSCTYNDSCANYHGCSLCGDKGHGAGLCRPVP